ACIGAAASGVANAPDKEYFQNEAVKEQFRLRLSAKDVGAFEHDTSGPSYGPYDTPPPTTSSSSSSSGPGGGPGNRAGGRQGAGGAQGAGGGGEGGGGSTGKHAGCGCRTAPSADPPAALAALLVAGWLRRRRR